MMYLNNQEQHLKEIVQELEPKHMMYLNTPRYDIEITCVVLEPKHMMYLNQMALTNNLRDLGLNQNI